MCEADSLHPLDLDDTAFTMLCNVVDVARAHDCQASHQDIRSALLTRFSGDGEAIERALACWAGYERRKQARAEVEIESSSLSSVLRFLSDIGLPFKEVSGVQGFLGAGVCIDCGCLLVDKLTARPSAVLHEAAHVAIVPARYRRLMRGSLFESFRIMAKDWAMMGLAPDHPFSRAMIQASDPEATAWSWAAGVHIGLDPREIIEDADYAGEGESMRWSLHSNSYVGIQGLKHAGFCEVCPNPYRPGHAEQTVYPRLRVWLQDAEPPAEFAQHLASTNFSGEAVLA